MRFSRPGCVGWGGAWSRWRGRQWDYSRHVIFYYGKGVGRLEDLGGRGQVPGEGTWGEACGLDNQTGALLGRAVGGASESPDRQHTAKYIMRRECLCFWAAEDTYRRGRRVGARVCGAGGERLGCLRETDGDKKKEGGKV